MAQVIDLRTRPERLRQDQAEDLRQALLPLVAEMPDTVNALLRHIDRATSAKSKWIFLMINSEQNDMVINHLAEHSRRPMVAVRLWSLCLRYLDRDTGEILMCRDQIASSLGENADNVSTLMTELVDFGAISRTRKRVGGMKGPGIVTYFLNPRVGTHLTGVERDAAQAQWAKLKPKQVDLSI